MRRTKLQWWLAGGLGLTGLLVVVGCGSGGNVSNDRNALSQDDILSVALPGDPTRVTEVETTPRAVFGKALSINNLIFQSANADERNAFSQGLAIFTANRINPSDGQGPFFNQLNCLGCHKAQNDAAGQVPTPVSRARTQDAFMVYGDYDAATGAFNSRPDAGGPILHKRSQVGFPVKSLPPLPGNPLVRSIGMRSAPAYIGRGLMEAISDEDVLANKAPTISGLLDQGGSPLQGFENRNTESRQIVGGSPVIRLARFGLRGAGPTMLQFALGNAPAGLISPFSPGLNTPSSIGDANPFPALTTDQLRRIRDMIRQIAPPTRETANLVPNVPEGSTAEDRGRILFGADFSHVNDPSPDPVQKRGMMPLALRDLTQGKLNCVGCHMPVSITGSSPAERGGIGARHLSNKRAYLFTDLLIHNMGTGLATTRFTLGPASDPLSIASYVADANVLFPTQSPQLVTLQNLGLANYGLTPRFPMTDVALPDQGRATPLTWRTATLMGVSLTGPPYMHDARVLAGQSVESALNEVIIRHASSGLAIPQGVGDLDPQSEAYRTVVNYMALPQSSKDDLIAFLKTL